MAQRPAAKAAGLPQSYRIQKDIELIIFIGLQGTGKNTFYRTRFTATHIHISKDKLRNNKHPDEKVKVLRHRVKVDWNLPVQADYKNFLPNLTGSSN